jgi:hypothetical protein
VSVPPVYLSSKALAGLRLTPRHRQGRLRRALRTLAASGTEGLVSVRTVRDVAACEVLAEEGGVLVYAVLARREVGGMLWGSELEARLRRSEESRLLHGRWH